MKRSDIVIISLIITVLLAVDIYLLSSNRTLRKEVALCDSKVGYEAGRQVFW